MSFIVAGCALLLALIASIILDYTSAGSERDIMSNPFMRGEPQHGWDSSCADAEPHSVTVLLDGQ
jgi:hypothetical protein